jgi:hypothetical protein
MQRLLQRAEEKDGDDGDSDDDWDCAHLGRAAGKHSEVMRCNML